MYMYQCAKVLQLNKMLRQMTDCDESDVMIAADAAGGIGTVWHPHMHYFNKNETQRHDLLKVHCMFVKVYRIYSCKLVNINHYYHICAFVML